MKIDAPIEEHLANHYAGITAVLSGLRALIDDLHESGYVDKGRIADRVMLFVGDNGEPIPAVEQLARLIRNGDLSTPANIPPILGVIDGGKQD